MLTVNSPLRLMNSRVPSSGSTSQNVRHRLRSAIRQFETPHPALARHLRHAVQTGTYCCYRPELPVTWDVDTTPGGHAFPDYVANGRLPAAVAFAAEGLSTSC